MHKRQVSSLIFCFCLGMALYLPLAVAAYVYDGSVPLLWAIIEVFDWPGRRRLPAWPS